MASLTVWKRITYIRWVKLIIEYNKTAIASKASGAFSDFVASSLYFSQYSLAPPSEQATNLSVSATNSSLLIKSTIRALKYDNITNT